MTKGDELRAAIAAQGSVLVMFSGGLDSALLAKLAHDALGQRAAALTIDSSVVPRSETALAKEVADAIGVRRYVLTLDEIGLAHFAANPVDRCYHCRKHRDAEAWRWAHEHGLDTVADGLNYSDLSDYRPGLKAASEDRIWHPFIELRVTKDDIRTLSRELELPGWDRPSMACLASRFPHGFAVTGDRLKRVDRAEEYLRALGFKKVRVRYFPYELGLVEVDDLQRALEHRDQIVARLRELGFGFVALHLEDFASGTMNRTAGA
ncbi:MAG: ATP-dependent sacrificial sulfur transferase LarE [Dehalococcoidia bacterium]|nr:ATP-dependent sacrificial sulfur transferase LarE [Dehalococcoidia bacterium]